MHRLSNAVQLHIIAVAQSGKTFLSYDTLVEPDSRLILIYNKQIQKRLYQELHQVALRARQQLN